MVRPPYTAVLRLIAYAERYWPSIDGEAASQGGTDYFDLPFDRFLNAIQWWVSQRVKDPERFIADLDRPLDGTVRSSVVTERDIEEDGASFMAFASAFGVKPPVADAGTPTALPSA